MSKKHPPEHPGQPRPVTADMVHSSDPAAPTELKTGVPANLQAERVSAGAASSEIQSQRTADLDAAAFAKRNATHRRPPATIAVQPDPRALQPAAQREAAEPAEVRGRHRNSGQRDHKGAR